MAAKSIASCLMKTLPRLLKKAVPPGQRPDMDKAASMEEEFIFAIGNAPTALVRLYELMQEEKIHPKLIIGVPVGFVNVVQSK